MHILVALDGSSYANAVASVALQLAAAHQGSRVTALHVVNVKVASGNLLTDLPGRLGFEPAIVSAEVEAGRLAEAEAILGAFARRAQAEGIEVARVVRAGAIPQVLADAASDADLLIMGVRGETEDAFPGQGGRLAGILPIDNTPVLLVPKGVTRIDAVALGYDGSIGARHAARAVRTCCVGLGVPIHGIYVSSESSGGVVLDELDQRLGVSVVRHVVSGAPHQAIAATAKSVGAEVIALGFSGRSKVKDFLFGTLGERVVLEGAFAVLLAY